MKKKKALKEDLFETSGWSLKAYKEVGAVLHDIFCDDPPDYFKDNINSIANTRINGRRISSKNQKEAFRIFLRINSMIEVAYHHLALYNKNSDSGPARKKRLRCGKRIMSLCRQKSKVHWKGEWSYFIQYALADQPAEETDGIWSLCYFTTELVDMMYCLYLEHIT